ncbi:YczE/YyaS/YitT family protein [Falsibacillus pallidus]|uniref:Membrane protein YczE n=1 Tax=Falsibacillus pallidus TaxID=493781 RepID=A0A370GLD7_9BACI|nr:YitT family protein [Falsibacillus pallidus]RDI44099.1 hypothetical protein DFR59_103163 [Falsibacillus pallidus]
MDKRKSIIARFAFFIVGLLIMSLGIVFLILADLGATPWDVLHVGLYEQLGLTIGSWSILIGCIVLLSSSILSRKIPKVGAYLNMLLVGFFIDLYMLLPFMKTPDTLIGKIIMFLVGMVVMAYGMGLYIAAGIGAGPRDSLMLAVNERTGWKISHVRRAMEIVVLAIGWQLGGPVYYGTIFFSLSIGTLVGIALPQCQKTVDYLMEKAVSVKKTISTNEIDRGAKL